MDIRISEAEADGGRSNDRSRKDVGWIRVGEPSRHALNPGVEACERSSNEHPGEEADSLVEEVIGVVGDRARIFAYENTS